MKQYDLGLNLSTRRTRKSIFIDEMNVVISLVVVARERGSP